MDLGTAAVAIVVAAIAFIGGYYSSRWQARHALEQWRRERLLEFCSDLLAAGNEITDFAWESGPTATVQRMRRAFASILLLSEELGDAANAYVEAVEVTLARFMRTLNSTTPVDMEHLDNDVLASASNAKNAAGRLTAVAHYVLLDKWPGNKRSIRWAWRIGQRAGRVRARIRGERTTRGPADFVRVSVSAFNLRFPSVARDALNATVQTLSPRLRWLLRNLTRPWRARR